MGTWGAAPTSPKDLLLRTGVEQRFALFRGENFDDFSQSRFFEFRNLGGICSALTFPSELSVLLPILHVKRSDLGLLRRG